MKTPRLKLFGRSGCNLELFSKDSFYIVRKFSKSKDYNQRIIIQAKKQKAFTDNSIFHSPCVFDIKEAGERAYFDMEYIPGEKYSEFFQHCSIFEINNMAENFLSFIDSELDQSEFVKLPEEMILDKIELIKPLLSRKTNTNIIIKNVLAFLETRIPSDYIPLGPCHGDLTFSNVIFSNKKIFLIDFLDSFIESPLVDIVKLRQDTKFYWSLMLDTEIPSYQRNKLIQILRYFDTVIEDFFKNRDYYLTWYNYLEKFNLLRILPYLEDKKEIDFVINALNNK